MGTNDLPICMPSVLGLWAYISGKSLVTIIKCSSVCKHLETNSILCDAQHGFRKNRSCKTQLITAVHDIATRLSSGDQVGILFLDFSKAFDKVPHARLLHKLEYYGIRGAYLERIKDFLTNRTQQVGIDNKISVPFPVLLVYHRGLCWAPFYAFHSSMTCLVISTLY